VFADASALQHDMIDAERAQAAAHGKAGLAAADDDDIRISHGRVSFEWGDRGGRRAGRGGRAPQAMAGVLTPIEIGTPLVTMSNTAERAFDCITICSSCSGLASPSISKETLIP
jgi:hypothetical protein